MKILSVFNIFLIANLLLTGCTNQLAKIYQENPPSCLPPILSTGYPYDVEKDTIPQGIKKEIPPLIWEPQFTDEQLEKMPHRVISNDIVASKDFIWYASGTDVVSYQINTKEINVYDLSSITPKYGRVSGILLDSRNAIWVTISGSEGTPVAKYDPITDTFVPEIFINETGLPLSLENQDLYSTDPKIYEFDSNKKILLLDQRLWILDEKTSTAQKLLDKQEGLILYNIAIGHDKAIWLVYQFTIEKKIETGQNEAQIYQLRNGSLDEIIINISETAGKVDFPLTIDNNDNLWISNIGWVELLDKPISNRGIQQEAIFYKLIESPLFVQEGGRSTYGYYEPRHIFSSQSGFIWYSSSPGLIRLNPETGDWCLMARGIDAKVTETPDGSIWFADEQLYKLIRNE